MWTSTLMVWRSLLVLLMFMYSMMGRMLMPCRQQKQRQQRQQRLAAARG